MIKKIACLLFWGFIPVLVLSQSYTISGYVKDKISGEILIGANIYNPKKENGTATNNYGFYSYTTDADSVTLVISYIGYAIETVSFFLTEDLDLNIELRTGEMLQEIVVTADERLEETTRMSRVTIPVQQIKSLPKFLGEVDVLKVLQMLPGVQSGTEGTSGFYVRGGGPDQNLMLLDGVPVYNASHLFGFFSVFNADAINNVELVKGGFPARYGGRLSSVLDITMKEGNKEKIIGEGSIGLISSKLTLDGPINDKTTFLISGRRTYIDILARPFISDLEPDEKVGYYFYDVNMKINHRFSDKNRIYLSSYFGDDKAFLKHKYEYESYSDEGEFGLSWGNFIGALRWNHIFNPKLFSNITLTRSRYIFDIFDEYKEFDNSNGGIVSYDYSIQYYSQIDDWAGKMDFQYVPSPNVDIKMGVSLTRHSFEPGVLALKDTDIDTTLGSKQTFGNEFFAYSEADVQLTKKLKINSGLHFSLFNVNNINYTSLEPRIAVNYKLPNRFSLKGSYAKMKQYLHLLTNGGIGLPTDLWVPATKKVNPQESHQFALGVAKTISEFEITVEGYYKTMNNLIAYKEGASYLQIREDWEDKVIEGEGESYGMEFFVQKKYGKWNGWLGYTLSWTNRQFDELNFGKKFPYKYDRRHDINVAIAYQPKDNISYSMSWVFGTGNAVSLPISEYLVIDPNSRPEYIDTTPVEHYGGRNQYRMNAYHRLDISASWTKKKRWGERIWSIGAYNAYNQKNPFFLRFSESEYQNPSTGELEYQKKLIQYSLFPLIPSVTYSFKF